MDKRELPDEKVIKNINKALERADKLELVFNKGSFSLKGVKFSGKDPPTALSINNSSIHVAGMKWFLREDLLSLCISKLNFVMKNRGKEPSQHQNVIPSKLRRRHCMSKVAEIFDLSGKITPIKATMKMDLHNLVKRGLDWDDVLPDDERNWKPQISQSNYTC